MKKFAHHLAVLLSFFLLIHACGPTDQEIRENETATQDSLARVQEMKNAAAEMAEAKQKEEEQQQDTKADQKDENSEAEQTVEEYSPIVFDQDGRYTLQVESWRSEIKAEQNVDRWQKRGFDDAFVVSYGDESTGDIWFRIRLGRFGSYSMAQRQKEIIESDFNIPAWIDNQTE
ncbi:MAG: SPOR domain-containing protein [Balneolales bacterium]